MEVISSNANDTSNGTGARTIRIGYINTSNQLTVSADITLNGTTAVALAFNANFILWMETTTVGSNAVAVGNYHASNCGAPGRPRNKLLLGETDRCLAGSWCRLATLGTLPIGAVNAIATTQDMRLRATGPNPVSNARY